MKKWISRNLMVPATVLGLAAACSDTPVDPDDDHAEPEGVNLVMSGSVVASYDGDEQAWTGGLEVDVGASSSYITVQFVDHDGDPLELDDDLHLEVDVQNESIAAFTQGTSGEFGGNLEGREAGQTGLSFKLMHGDHADFITTPVTADVH